MARIFTAEAVGWQSSARESDCSPTHLRRSGATSLRPVHGVSSVSVCVLGDVLQGEGKIGGASVGEAAAEDGDEVLASVGLRHEFCRAWTLRRNAALISGGGSSSASMASIRYSAACWARRRRVSSFFTSRTSRSIWWREDSGGS
ncbi:MAG TPA: hypothetical protein VGK01_04685 [Candidatus Angelobacter sp.]